MNDEESQNLIGQKYHDELYSYDMRDYSKDAQPIQTKI